ncbi:hypothetical protein [uncultured Acetobacteroides sp.]|uniref:hypothetical protein n=1 Tax=uncultured Acetobacteroides sp. TaxID=1760811 RepID=UPI0029F48801|nr:hypothetical protein [uncultured Acetobacteroides sp.]
MARIEDYINRHREEFDSESPSDEHFKSFEQKLRFAGSSLQPKKQRRLPFAQVAAVAVLLVASALLYDQLFVANTNEYSNEIKVIRSSYNEVLDAKYNQINIAVDKLPESVRKDYEKQVESIKKQTSIMEKASEMSANNPEMRQALMMHYRKTDRILTRMAIKAEKNEQQNAQNSK